MALTSLRNTMAAVAVLFLLAACSSAGVSVPSAAQSDLVASPASDVSADGTTPSTLTFTARDSEGAIMRNVDVCFVITDGDGGMLSHGPWSTGANGEASATLRSNQAGAVEVTVYACGTGSFITLGSVTVTFSQDLLSIDPAGLSDGEAGTEYTFTFSASDIPAGVSQVIFNWSFGDGAGSTGSATESVSNGQASTTASYTYGQDGAYGLVVELRDASDDSLLDVQSVTVTIGAAIERDFDLDVCDVWVAATQGGQGVTSDVWDISQIPVGATFDIEYNAFSIPDRYRIEDPTGSLALDTGWRGASQYEGDPLYPGGIAGPGQGEEQDLFTKQAGQDEFRVTVIGPQSGTLWNYSIRCRVP